MKNLYFCVSNGTFLLNKKLPYATKEAIVNCNEMFSMIEEVDTNLNMALSTNKKDFKKTVKRWLYELGDDDE